MIELLSIYITGFLVYFSILIKETKEEVELNLKTFIWLLVLSLGWFVTLPWYLLSERGA